MHITVVFAIINLSDKILLVNNKDKEGIERWTLPGGKVEEEETLYDALCREVLEETKYRVMQAEIAYIHEAFFSNVTAHIRATIFHAQVDPVQEFSANDPSQSVIAKKWISISNLPKYIKNEEICLPLQEWLTHPRTSSYFFTKDMKW